MKSERWRRFFVGTSAASIFGVSVTVIFGFVVLVVVGNNLPTMKANPDRYLLGAALILATLQTMMIGATFFLGRLTPQRYEYVFMTVEFGSMTAYFNSGEPNQMARDGWEIVQMNDNGLLLRRPLG